MAGPSAIIPIQVTAGGGPTGDPNLIQSGDYNAMIVAADIQRAATSDALVIAELYTGGVVSGANLIGRWVYDKGLSEWVQAIPIDLTRVTDSQYGEQDAGSPTTGTTRDLKTGHNMPASGTCTVWDRSAGAEIATAHAFTVAGDVITFVDPGVTAESDYFHVDGTCEFNDLLERSNGGLWSPRASSAIRAVWDAGLECEATVDDTVDTGVNISFAGKALATAIPRLVSIYALFDVVDSGGKKDKLKFGCGNANGDDTHTGGAGLIKSGKGNDKWKKLFYGFTYGNFTEASDSEFDEGDTAFETSWQAAAIGDGVNVSYNTQTTSALGDDEGIQNKVVSAFALGMASGNNGMTGASIMMGLEDQGALTVTLKTLKLGIVE